MIWLLQYLLVPESTSMSTEKKKKKANSEMDFEHVQYLFINPLYPQDY